MTLGAGTRLGPYEIVSALGAGGMGEVYRARDTRLDRLIALKVMPPHLAGDATFRERFEREARAISQLNHPNICTLHDVGRESGVDFLVMELLEGETLADRLTRGPLPLAIALQIAVQIAQGLERAHAAGIVHRDLKPANVFLVRPGSASTSPIVKLLDFGLAKSGSLLTSGETQSPTLAQALTGHGTILGTLHYMAPEQLEGSDVDARADVFAFGAVLYEMLTGRQAFNGKSQASVIASILSAAPPAISTLQPLTPAVLDHLVERALAKEREERWSSMHDLLLQLRWLAALPTAAGSTATGSASRHRRWGIAAAAVLVVSAAVAGWLITRDPQVAPVAPIHFQIEPPPDTTFFAAGFNATSMTPVVSPDGQRILLPAVDQRTVRRLWLRALDSADLKLLPGTERASAPFWSPDNRSIAFFADGKLLRLDLDGGVPRVLCDAPQGLGGTWNSDGVIVFAPVAEGPLQRVAATGGTPVAITKLADGHLSHRFPVFLPDGRRFLFLARGNASAAILAGSLDSSDLRQVLPIDSRVTYVNPGWLGFAQSGTLFAQRFDADELTTTGEPIAIRQGISVEAGSGAASVSFSQTGVVVFRSTGAAANRNTLTWYSRTGAALSAVGESGDYGVPQLAFDDRRLVIVHRAAVWMRDLVRGSFLRVTQGGGDCCPVLSPDGQQIVFRRGPNDLALQSTAGTGSATVILSDGLTNTPTHWTPDGKAIIYQVRGNVMLLPLNDPRTPRPLVAGPSNEEQGRLSPDGRWLAYVSDESGSPEVYVQDYPGLSQKWPISTAGGADPQWSRDGSELFFLDASQKLMAVAIKRGPTFDAGVPVPLFQVRVSGLVDVRTHYQVSADGQRFLVNAIDAASRGAPAEVIVNWPALLQK